MTQAMKDSFQLTYFPLNVEAKGFVSALELGISSLFRPCVCFDEGGARPALPSVETVEEDPVRNDPSSTSISVINHKLLRAARAGRVDSINAMLELGADIETRRPLALSLSLRNLQEGSRPRGSLRSEGTLSMKRGAAPTDHSERAEGLTALMCAAQGGYQEACSALVSSGACVNASDETGMTPLHYAATSASHATYAVLAAYGADVKARDDRGHLAVDCVPSAKLLSAEERREWQSVSRGLGGTGTLWSRLRSSGRRHSA